MRNFAYARAFQMENRPYFISEIIETYIAGDWGEDASSADSPCMVSCVRGADIVPIENNDFANIPIRWISKKSFNSRLLKSGDIIIEKSGGSPTQSTGRVVYISDDLLKQKEAIVCSNFCSAFRIKEGWNPKYVYYYLKHIYNSGVFFNFEGKTSGLKNLQMESAFNSISISYIEKCEQDAIVQHLSTIEEKLAINRKINDNLEAMAKQLYDYWFVQFEFPDGQGRPYKSNGGSMIWNENLNRMIPSNWTDCLLGDYIGRITNGLNPRKNFTLGKGSNYYVSIRSLIGTDIDWDSCEKCDDDALYKINRRSQLKIHDVIFSAIGTIGRTYYIQEEPNNWNISETSFTLRAKDDIPSDFFYSLLRSDEIQLSADKSAMGSTLRCLVMDSLCKIRTVAVDPKIMGMYSEVASPILKSIYERNKNTRDLLSQRDNLLSLLMNGQVSAV